MSGRVLIVDDSPDDVVMLERFLAGEATFIRGVSDSKEAKRAFSEFEPDLVLLDLHMPPPDGFEILRELRDARSRLGFLPVVVLTGDAGQAARNTALHLGADDFLTKPLDRNEVVLRVRNLLSARRLHVELARAYQHKSMFLATISHELRTPLSAIIGYSELMITARKGRYDDATKVKFLTQINSGGHDLLALINDILDLSKVESGQMVLLIEDVVIADAVRAVVGTMEPLAKKKTIRLETDVDTAGQVPADLGKLKQMLLNLVSNAVKFTPDGGCVTISALRLASTVEISVSDTGIGIAETNQREVFDDFRQLDSAIARQEHGTGLGLALTKRFAELHGGQIGLVSDLGKGSVFTVRLPLKRAEVPATHPEHSSRKIEDDPRVVALQDRR